jgi:hypothetical protein
MSLYELASYVAYSLQQQLRARFDGPGRLVKA